MGFPGHKYDVLLFHGLCLSLIETIDGFAFMCRLTLLVGNHGMDGLAFGTHGIYAYRSAQSSGIAPIVFVLCMGASYRTHK